MVVIKESDMSTKNILSAGNRMTVAINEIKLQLRHFNCETGCHICFTRNL